MPVLDLRIVLENELALSQSSASVSGGRTLKYIPGAALFGAAATHYSEFGAERAFELFQSSRVRFENGLLEVGGVRALPIPLSFHREKGIEHGPVFNLAVGARPKEKQLEPIGEGYFTHAQEFASVHTAYTMRTSVEEHGRARDGFLFGMELLKEGQAFRARLRAELAGDLEDVKKLLLGQTARLGRSRTAELGKVRVEAAESGTNFELVAGRTKRLVVLCVSDLALRDDETGAPRLEPRGSDFGVNRARLDLGRSFLRFRRYSPFNGYRRRPDLERQVIVAGSVLVFDDADIDLDTVRAHVESGAGEYTRDGLGEVLVQPRFLEEETLSIRAATAKKTSVPTAAPEPSDELGRWLRTRNDAERHQRDAFEHSRSLADAMKCYRTVPTAQWGEIRSIAARARVANRTRDQLIAALREHLAVFDSERDQENKRAASADRREARGTTARRWGEQRGGRNASQRLIELIAGSPELLAVPAVELLAARMVRVVRQREEP